MADYDNPLGHSTKFEVTLSAVVDGKDYLWGVKTIKSASTVPNVAVSW
jgi:hypothetical protein